MKTTVRLQKTVFTCVLGLSLFAISLSAKAQSGPGGGSSNLSNGLKFDSYTHVPGADLTVGAKYIFSNVTDNVDALVRIDSLVNGAKVDKIDDNSNGTGYKDAFQPAVKSGNVIGFSYAVFSFRFVQHGDTTKPVSLQNVYATALDIDGNATLKEFVRLNMNSGGAMSYLTSTLDITLSQILSGSGNFMALNILGIERNGIDTTALSNMFTASNSNINGFTLAYGTFTATPTTTSRQFSLYMKGFTYSLNTLPVKLASFTATLNNKTTDLKWTTATEMNVSHFVVERSTDGTHFSDAGTVFAYGNSTDAKNYAFPDNISSIQSNVLYYRLRMVDVDGKSEYSETRIIRIAGKSETNVTIVTYPNPATNELHVTIPSNWQNKKVVYEFFNAAGQTARRLESASSSQTENLDLSAVAPGFYILKVSCGTETAQQKVIKH